MKAAGVVASMVKRSGAPPPPPPPPPQPGTASVPPAPPPLLMERSSGQPAGRAPPWRAQQGSSGSSAGLPSPERQRGQPGQPGQLHVPTIHALEHVVARELRAHAASSVSEQLAAVVAALQDLAHSGGSDALWVDAPRWQVGETDIGDDATLTDFSATGGDDRYADYDFAY
jgi:hypothetical protein